MHVSISFLLSSNSIDVFFILSQLLQRYQICLPIFCQSASINPMSATSFDHTSPVTPSSPSNFKSKLLYVKLGSELILLLLQRFSFFACLSKISSLLITISQYCTFPFTSNSLFLHFSDSLNCISHAKLIPLLLPALITGCLHPSFLHYLLTKHQFLSHWQSSQGVEGLSVCLSATQGSPVSPIVSPIC